MGGGLFEVGLAYEQGEQIRTRVRYGATSEANSGVDQRLLTCDQASVLCNLDVFERGAFLIDVAHEGLHDLLGGIVQRFVFAADGEPFAATDEVGHFAVRAPESEWAATGVVVTQEALSLMRNTNHPRFRGCAPRGLFGSTKPASTK
ncbi:MAG TPA: hypothetical protein VFP54_05175 [Acidimicrobiales bacterium]|nr:hypothetical protein [Acidimicrobiales bacterium]